MTLFSGSELSCVRGGRLVFSGLAFRVAAGGALILSGANGSGKSSLLRLMAGLLAPESGTITWGGTPIRRDREAHCARVHYVGHADAVKPTLTVAENLAFWAALRGQGRSALAPALEGLGLTPFADLPGRLLSAGQKRRVALARLLAAPAELWLLDEPMVGLDAAATAALGRAIADHRGGGGRVVMATHIPIKVSQSSELSLESFAPDSTRARPPDHVLANRLA